MDMAEGLRKLLKAGKCVITKEEVNKVFCENEEIKILNIRNWKKKEEAIEGEKEIMKNKGSVNLERMKVMVKNNSM